VGGAAGNRLGHDADLMMLEKFDSHATQEANAGGTAPCYQSGTTWDRRSPGGVSTSTEKPGRSALFEVTLDDGRRISAWACYAQSTYAGLLEGLPDRRFNDRLLADLVLRAASLFDGSPIHIIAPTRTDDTFEHGSRRHAFERLPRFWVAAAFDSEPIDTGKEWSALTVIWFQDEPLPVTAKAHAKVRALDWNAAAKDYELS